MKNIIMLALILASRMLGLFMILPVFSAHAHTLPGTTPFLIGLALAIYGLTQAALQLPFGASSDRFGRKPVIALGLLLFCIGSVTAALSHTIMGVIIGRALQGAGAVGSTLLALAADLTPDESRSKTMAFLGMSIGVAFMLALALGPMVFAAWQLSGIFWVSAGLALFSLLLLFTGLPTPPKLAHLDVGTQKHSLKKLLMHKGLLQLDFGIASMHALFTSTFIAVPILLVHQLKFSTAHQITLYTTIMVLAFLISIPFIILAEKHGKMKSVFLGGIACLALTECSLYLWQTRTALTLILVLFFAAFTLLEALLPSLVSKYAPLKQKGSAIGIYSTSQFAGIFLGGSLGGVVYQHLGTNATFLMGTLIATLWLVIAAPMQPPHLSTVIISLKNTDNIDSLAHLLDTTEGIASQAFAPQEKLLYVKINKQIISEYELRNLLERGNLS